MFFVSFHAPASSTAPCKGGKEKVREGNGEVLQLSGKASEYVGKEERAAATGGISLQLNSLTCVTRLIAIHHDSETDGKCICLVLESLFCFFLSLPLWCTSAKPVGPAWVSTDVPERQRFSMCARSYCTTKINLLDWSQVFGLASANLLPCKADPYVVYTNRRGHMELLTLRCSVCSLWHEGPRCQHRSLSDLNK